MHETRTPIFCALCRSRCGAVAIVDDGKLIAQLPDPDHPTGKALCIKGRSAPEIVHNSQRLLHPLIRTTPKTEADPKWREVSWDVALAKVAEELDKIRQQHGSEAVAFGVTSPSGSPISDGIKWIERLVNAFGSPNLVRGTEICNWHKDFSHAYTFGRGISAPEFSKSGTIVLWGHNPSTAWLDHATSVAEACTRGAKLVVVDPRRIGFASRAAEWLQVRPGSDGALALGIAGVMIREGWFDQSFMRDWSNGPLLVRSDTGSFVREGDIDGSNSKRMVAWDRLSNGLAFYDAHMGTYDRPSEQLTLFANKRLRLAGAEVECRSAMTLYAELCNSLAPEFIEKETGVPFAQIRRTARVIHENGPVSYYCWSGISQHTNSTQTDRAIALLFALTGSFDAPGGNVEFTKHRTFDASGAALMTPDQRAKCVELSRRPLGPASKGWIGSDSLYDAITNEDPYKIRGFANFGANLVMSHAAPDRARKALQNLEFFVHSDVVMTPTAAMADVVLPVNTPWEREGLKVGFEVSQSAEELIQLRQAVVPSAGESRSDTWIVFNLASRLGLGEQFWNGDIDSGLQAIVEPLGIKLDELRANPAGIRLPLKTTYRKYAEGRTTPIGFATHTRKIEVYSELFHRHGYDPLPRYRKGLQLADKQKRRFPLLLTSAKIPQYCHSQHRHVPALRKRVPEPLIELHSRTAYERGIIEGDWVQLRTRNGTVQMRASFNDELSPSVVCAQYGWWQDNQAMSLPRYDPLTSCGANFNLLLADDILDEISGSAPHRSYPCDVEALDSNVGRWQGWREFVVLETQEETEDVRSIWLRPTDGSSVAAFKPGQHITLRIERSGQSLVRCYSITSTSSSKDRYRITVKRIKSQSGRPHGIVSRLLNECSPGLTVDVRSPGGNFNLDEMGERPLTMVGGGIGITPFLSMLAHLAEAQPNRRVHLFRQMRSGSENICAGETAALRKRLPNLRITTFFSAPSRGDLAQPGFDGRGRITAPMLLNAFPDEATIYYLCGPSEMMRALVDALEHSGVEPSRIRTEAFGPSSIPTTAATVASAKITFVQSGKIGMWTPAAGTLLDFAETQGIAISSGCRAGQCETCRVRLLKGSVASTAQAETADSCLACTCYPASDLILDI